MIGLVLVPPYFCTQIAVGSADSKTDTFDEQEDSFVLVRPQAMVGHYRVDFLVTVKFHAGHTPIDAIVIECDGHDFHERTKEQAARDKRRDRFLALRGLRVLRFTGGEIHKNAYGCASEVMDCLYDIWERQAK